MRSSRDGEVWSPWVTASNPGSVPEDLSPGRYLQWAAVFKYSSNPHGSVLGNVWVQHEPKPLIITPSIGIVVEQDDNLLWYAKDSTSPGRLIESYLWDFGDDSGIVSDGIVKKSFMDTTEVGVPYLVKLTVLDDTPASDSVLVPVEVL
jgi:hypothetical protein